MGQKFIQNLWQQKNLLQLFFQKRFILSYRFSRIQCNVWRTILQLLLDGLLCLFIFYSRWELWWQMRKIQSHPPLMTPWACCAVSMPAKAEEHLRTRRWQISTPLETKRRLRNWRNTRSNHQNRWHPRSPSEHRGGPTLHLSQVSDDCLGVWKCVFAENNIHFTVTMSQVCCSEH